MHRCQSNRLTYSAPLSVLLPPRPKLPKPLPRKPALPLRKEGLGTVVARPLSPANLLQTPGFKRGRQLFFMRLAPPPARRLHHILRRLYKVLRQEVRLSGPSRASRGPVFRIPARHPALPSSLPSEAPRVQGLGGSLEDEADRPAAGFDGVHDSAEVVRFPHVLPKNGARFLEDVPKHDHAAVLCVAPFGQGLRKKVVRVNQAG